MRVLFVNLMIVTLLVGSSYGDTLRGEIVVASLSEEIDEDLARKLVDSANWCFKRAQRGLEFEMTWTYMKRPDFVLRLTGAVKDECTLLVGSEKLHLEKGLSEPEASEKIADFFERIGVEVTRAEFDGTTMFILSDGEQSVGIKQDADKPTIVFSDFKSVGDMEAVAFATLFPKQDDEIRLIILHKEMNIEDKVARAFPEKKSSLAKNLANLMLYELEMARSEGQASWPFLLCHELGHILLDEPKGHVSRPCRVMNGGSADCCSCKKKKCPRLTGSEWEDILRESGPKAEPSLLH